LQPVADYEASEGGSEPGEEGEASASSPKDLVLFAARAARQNLLFCLVIAATIAVLGSTVVVAIPPVYDATFKIFVQDGGAVTSSLTSGRDRYRPIEGARGLEEFILARDNLLSIVREAKLVDKWPSTRPLPLRLKDQLSEALVGAPARKDMERGFVEMLATSISGAKDGESVRIHAQWRDKQSAYDIARLVQRNFLAARASHDLGPIQRAIPFLESQQQQADQAIEDAVQATKSQGTPVTPVLPTPQAPPKASGNEANLAELASLSRQLAETRREQRALVEPWRRRITELKTQLIDMKVSYSNEHPLIQQIEARITAASEVPEELAALRQKEAELLNTLSSRTGSRAAGEAAIARAESRQESQGEDPELALSRSRVFAALRKSDEVAGRLENARIELATAEADFKHRYVVVEEPEVPAKPLKAKQPLLFTLVLLASIVIGIVAGTVKELMRGRLVEPWQVRAIGLPLLAEVDIKRLPPPKGP
jgi:hypothetical protein